jgi:hypothetical protein
MNEIRLIRDQLALERAHTLEVVNDCARACERARGPAPPGSAALEAFRRACVDYLRFVLGCFEQRDQRLAALPRGLALEDERPGRNGAALEELEAARASPEAWKRLADYLGSDWSNRRRAIEARLAAKAQVTDWRAFSRLDADSILAERELFSRVRATLPDGIGPDRSP